MPSILIIPKHHGGMTSLPPLRMRNGSPTSPAVPHPPYQGEASRSSTHRVIWIIIYLSLCVQFINRAIVLCPIVMWLVWLTPCIYDGRYPSLGKEWEYHGCASAGENVYIVCSIHQGCYHRAEERMWVFGSVISRFVGNSGWGCWNRMLP